MDSDWGPRSRPTSPGGSAPSGGVPSGGLKEYIRAVRAIFDTWQKGTKLDFQGEFYKMNLMIPYFDPGPVEHPDLPIHISAVGPQMARMAGQVCDGLGWHGFHTPKHLKEVVFANFRDGAESVGRNASELEFRGGCYIVTGNTDEELEKGRRSIRKDVSFYGSTPGVPWCPFLCMASTTSATSFMGCPARASGRR